MDITPELLTIQQGKMREKFGHLTSGFGDEVIKKLTADLLNAFLRKHHLSNSVRLSADFEVSVDSLFTFMANLPMLEIFFNPKLMGNLDDSSVSLLKQFLQDFFTYILSAPRSEETEVLLAQFCLLSWRECFVFPSQRRLAGIMSDIIVNKISSSPLHWPFISDPSISKEFAVCSWDLALVSILRLVDRTLQTLYPSDNTQTPKPGCHPSNNCLGDLDLLYEMCFEQLSGSDNEDQTSRTYDTSLFLKGAFEFLHQISKMHNQLNLSRPCLFTFVPNFHEDLTLRSRLGLGRKFYLNRACHLLPRLRKSLNEIPSEWNKLFIDRDCLYLQKLIGSLLFPVGEDATHYNHTDVVTWALNHGLFVKEFALAFLKDTVSDDVLHGAAIIPSLARQTTMLTSDSDVSLALTRKLRNLRARNLPTSLHEDLLRKLISLLPPEVKAIVLGHLHSKSDKYSTPLSSEEPKFRCYSRNFFNRLAAGPALSDLKTVSVSDLPWRDPRANTISKEALLDADLLLMTRPIDFLTELVRFPVIQNSSALLPLVFTILGHVSYSFGVHLYGSEKSVMQRLVTSLLTHFDADMSKERELVSAWQDENYQRTSLMQYLPHNSHLNPLQVALAAQAVLFSNAYIDNTTAANSGPRKLWTCSFACLLDQSASWSQLSDLIEEVFTTRIHAMTVAQSLALLLLPRVPTDLPLAKFVTPCVRLLERLQTPLAVRLCTALLSNVTSEGASDTEIGEDVGSVVTQLTQHLRDLLSNPNDGMHRLLMQCIDFLPPDLLGTVVITLPCCLLRSKLIDVDALNESTKGQFKFIVEPSLLKTPFDAFAKPLSSYDLEEVLQLVSLCDGAWQTIVNFLLMSSQTPEIRNTWNCLSEPTVILALQAFLHRINSLEEVDAAECWARAIGFLDQLIANGLISLPFTPRSTSSSCTTSCSIFLGQYRGSLDFFDLTFALLRVIDHSTEKASVPNVPLGRVCQTLAVLGQRLVARLAVRRDSGTPEPVDKTGVCVLIEQAVLVIAEVNDYIERRDATANPLLKHLSASLEIIVNSLTCQWEHQDAEKQCGGS